jgi:hypothetical protein
MSDINNPVYPRRFRPVLDISVTRSVPTENIYADALGNLYVDANGILVTDGTGVGQLFTADLIRLI